MRIESIEPVPRLIKTSDVLTVTITPRMTIPRPILQRTILHPEGQLTLDLGMFSPAPFFPVPFILVRYWDDGDAVLLALLPGKSSPLYRASCLVTRPQISVSPFPCLLDGGDFLSYVLEVVGRYPWIGLAFCVLYVRDDLLQASSL